MKNDRVDNEVKKGKKEDDDPTRSANRVVEHNEKFNVPLQTEEEEAETFENAKVVHLANAKEIRRKKAGLDK